MEIKAEGMIKNYGDVHALKGISFSIPNKSVVGLVGHNGSGKTTLLEILSGLKKHDKGYLSVKVDRRFKDNLGVVLQNNAFYDDAKVGELIALFGSFYNKTIETNKLIDLTGIKNYINKLYRNLSGGMKQKVNIALALINKPELLILDEPTTGLDPLARRELWKIVKKYASETTIIISSHYMDEIEENCDHILILKDGNVIDNVPLKNLLIKQRMNLNSYYMEINK
jgi:ABC-2 type transport system ATP-binding protein